ncbi:MAG: PD-(D/E)XK nuclease family protein, partial [Treponema sp.]|jgi:hypothetical protein|nr:PD-(D/E)XK nuclease family protein [Treponema sp.]
VRRAGKKLSAYSAGQLFTGIQDCCAQGFSFSAVSNLLLNPRLPWKNRDLIDQLIDFGIKNNCLCSWTENNRTADAWLDAFNSLAGSREQRARAFYGEFRAALEKIHGARSFKDTIRYYFALRGQFLDMAQCSQETDAVLSRCISELLALAEIEDSFPDLRAPDPYGFFIEHLQETSYLAQETLRGVSILPYRTAACVPFTCHIVLGASQDNLSLVFSRLGFLTRIKKERLGLGDIDASEAFIAFHRLNSSLSAAFFCSRQSFDGFKIPHSSLGAAEEPLIRYAGAGTGEEGRSGEEGRLFAPDLFAAEESALEDPGGSVISELHEVQAGGFRAWMERRSGLKPGTEEAAEPRGRTLGGLIKKTYGETKPRISASALEPYFHCSVEWLYRRILKLESRRMETTLMAENVTGSLYHAVLDRFFKALAQRGGLLALPLAGDGGLPGDYPALLDASIREILQALPLLPGETTALSSLTSRFLRAQAGAIRHQTEHLLKGLLAFFGGFRVAGSELSYQMEEQDYCLVGKVDLLLTETPAEDAEDRGVIVDFKLNYLPKRRSCTGQGERGLENFQLPMYITLAEASGAAPVRTALFFNILKAETLVIFGCIRDQLSGKEKSGAGEDLFGAVMADFAAKTERYAQDMRGGNLSVFSAGEAQCGACMYHRVCRTLYTVKGERNLIAAALPGEHNG